MSETICLNYESDSNGKIKMEFDGEKNLDDIFCLLKRFLVSIGYNYSSVEEYTNKTENNDRLRNRIKYALEELETGCIENAKNHLYESLI